MEILFRPRISRMHFADVLCVGCHLVVFLLSILLFKNNNFHKAALKDLFYSYKNQRLKK